jgi:hypothetical protein
VNARNTERRYWANPDNSYHRRYQRMVNRRFATFLVCLSVVMAVTSFSWAALGALLAGFIIGVLMLAILLFILAELFIPMIEWLFGPFYYWLRGE